MVTTICSVCKTSNKIKYKHCFCCGNQLPTTDIVEDGGFIAFIKFIWFIVKKIWQAFLDNLYLFLLTISIGYFIFYSAVKDDPLYFVGWKNKEYVLKLIKDFSLIIFSAGIFTSSLKYLQYLKVFEKEFDRILTSNKFTNKVKESVESITFSKEFLHKQKNLEHIWKKVTLVMWEKQFPDLYIQLKDSLKNDFFKQNNISFYYKNFKIKYYITRIAESDFVEIEEHTTYTLVRPNEKLFDWDFKVAIDMVDSEDKKYPEIDLAIINDTANIFTPNENIECIGEKNTDDVFIKKIKMQLQGSKEYLIKRKVILKQNLNKDREYSFGSDRIISDLDVSIHYSDNINVVFSESWKVKFIKEEIRGDKISSYIFRGLMLPGEKFKLFFIKS